jgi:hypothetical protein
VSHLELYWQEKRRGQRLLLDLGDEGVAEVGGVRETKRGFDAFAKTVSYDPGRAAKDIASMDEAKGFVEGHRPWELFRGTDGITVQSEVRPAPDEE